MKKVLLLLAEFSITLLHAQNFITPFEKSNGKETTTYAQCITYYKALQLKYPSIIIKTFGQTDAGYPLHLILFGNGKSQDPKQWHLQHKAIVLVNNGIHPGEPDGIDASMMLLRDLASGKIKMPTNVILAIIPIYNIGGSLNRNSFSRVNQEGPLSYGFRGNAQNLDLNRDFIKNDSKNAKAFASIFHAVDPDVFIDNHVSDGADYQYTMTLLMTEHNKLGGEIGDYLHDIFAPAVFAGMEQKNWPMTPYVDFESGNTDKGWGAFYDSPRYSTGYAALFQTMGFMPETHMLKPFADRVKSDYALMQTMIETAATHANEIVAKRKASIDAVKKQQQFVLAWKTDSTQHETLNFKGYAAEHKISEVTGLSRLFYNHAKPFEKPVKYYSTFIADKLITKPKAYLIPQGWYAVIDILKLNKVELKQLEKDTIISVDTYHIDDYKSSTKPYEKHHYNFDVKTSVIKQSIQFLKGDYIVKTGQAADKYLVETLEPTSNDGFFAWNYFDAILQQKEGYSDYRWEDVAAKYLSEHPDVKQLLEEKKRTDTSFAASASMQLRFVYQHSPYYEPAHLRYSVYRVD